MMKGFKFYPQLESVDCGPACLRMVLSYYGCHLSLRQVKSTFSITRVGITLQDIFAAAKGFGFDAIAAKATVSQLYGLPMPVVLHWRQDHFIVLHKIVSKGSVGPKFYIADPSYGKVVLSEDEFKSQWAADTEKGIVLILSPGETFPNVSPAVLEAKTNNYHDLYIYSSKLFKGKSSSISLALIFFAIALASNWILPILFQRIIDQGVTQKQMSIVYSLLLAQLIIIISNIIADFINSKLLIKIGFETGIHMLKDFLGKLIKLPISFFDTRLNTDIIQRIDDQERLQSFLSHKLISFIISLLNLIIFLSIIAHYSIPAFLICAISALFSIIWMIAYLEKRKILDYSKFSVSSENRNNVYELINGMAEIKINNAEEKKITRWKQLQDKLNAITLLSLNLNYYQLFGIGIINKTKDLIIIGFCANQVIESRMTIGILMTISYLLGQVSRPVEQIVDFVRSFQDALLSFERMNDIQTKKEEGNEHNILLPQILSSGFFLDNIDFKYPGSYTKPVLSKINAEFPLGKVTAIVGASGSGKTTMMKILLGFYYPQEGSITLNSQILNKIDVKLWRDRCGVVMQDGYIFSGTVRENIALDNGEFNEERLMSALEIACIKDFILSLPMGIDTKIGKSGIELSGGQRQRLLIARAVYKNPSFLFFDEATSSLDANNEMQIMQNMEKFFVNKTVIIIAHRLSTVKNADHIIVLDNGRIIETGNHEQLSIKKSFYYNLIKNQLELGT
jgi:ATP-binding cassette subfamily B protein